MGQLDPHPGYCRRSIRLVRSDSTLQVPANLVEAAIGRRWRRGLEPMYVMFFQHGARVRMVFNQDGRGWKLWDLTARDKASRTASVQMCSRVVVSAWLPAGWGAGYVNVRRVAPYTLQFNLKEIKKW